MDEVDPAGTGLDSVSPECPIKSNSSILSTFKAPEEQPTYLAG